MAKAVFTMTCSDPNYSWGMSYLFPQNAQSAADQIQPDDPGSGKWEYSNLASGQFYYFNAYINAIGHSAATVNVNGATPSKFSFTVAGFPGVGSSDDCANQIKVD